MVITAHDEFQLINRNIDCFEERGYHEFVVFRAEIDQFNWGFQGVKEGMNIGEKYLDFAAGAKEMSEFDLTSIVSVRPLGTPWGDAYHGHEVGAVGSVMSEIGVSWRCFDVPTDQWSPCLETSVDCSRFLVVLRYTPIDL